MRHSLRVFRGVRYTMSELSEMSGVSAQVLRARLADGWTIEQAMCIPTPQQRRRGVVSNFAPPMGTGPGSNAQDFSNIEFPEKAKAQ